MRAAEGSCRVPRLAVGTGDMEEPPADWGKAWNFRGIRTPSWQGWGGPWCPRCRCRPLEPRLLGTGPSGSQEGASHRGAEGRHVGSGHCGPYGRLCCPSACPSSRGVLGLLGGIP